MAVEHGNLADSEYEPTDEELRELTRRAFSGVSERNAEALRKLHEEIARLRMELRDSLLARREEGRR